MAEPLVGRPNGAPESIGHGAWSDSSARSVLQLMVESVVEMVDFRVATLSVVLGDNLVTMAYAGPEAFRKAAMTVDPLSVLEPILAQSETWGRFHFLATENIRGELPGTWIETTRGTTHDGPDAWQPSDVLLGILNDEDGRLCGLLSVDSPTSGRRPDTQQRHLLERYAAQAERAVLTAFERESLVQRVAHAESARRLVRAASMPAQASLEAVLSNIHPPLVEGFSASGSWIEARGPGAVRHGYARARGGEIVQLPDHAQALAHRLGSMLWSQQRALVITDGPGPHPADDDLPGPVLDEARALLRALDLRSMLAVALGAGQECLGFLALTRRAQDPPWSAVETSSALEIGHDLGAALMAARALERERHLVDELQQLDDYRIHLIETLSHEMRTPLTVISGNLEMLQDVELDPEADRFREAINRGTTRMQRVVDDLLLLARISHPQQPVERAPLDLRLAVREVSAFVESTAEAKGIALHVEISERDLTILGHSAEIDRLLSNLLSNAVKYTRRGGNVRVRATRNQHLVELEVSDDGLGISRADQARLFTSFFRTTNPDALRESGTGLGLAIVSHIVQRHGGTVEVTSRLGEGSSFIVRLPAC